MAQIPLTAFFFDTESRNIVFKSAVPYAVDYEYDASFGEPQYFYAGSLFTDGDLQQVGTYKPASIDGTVAKVVEGDTMGFYPESQPV